MDQEFCLTVSTDWQQTCKTAFEFNFNTGKIPTT